MSESPAGDRRMRVALVTDAWFPQVNGVVRTLSSVMRELEAVGYQFLIVHPGLFRTMRCPKYPEIRLSMLPGRKLRQLLQGFEPDAIHIATEGPLGMAARAFCKRERLSFTTSFHTQFAKYLKVYFRVPERLSYAGLRWFHGPASHMLVPTPSVDRELRAHGFKNSVVWTRGVDTDMFRPRAKSFLDLPRPIFLCAGRVAHEKNIEAFLRTDLPGTKLIVGDGPALNELKRKYAKAVFVGYKHGEELAQHFAAADVFVFPSRTDTFGLVMLEALASGLPVAAYPVTGPIDVIRDDAVGVLDEDLGAAAMRALTLDPARCREYALGYSWRRCAEGMAQNLVKVCGGAPVSVSPQIA
jgi:glycosyltransferase involved in cell wall biosynthesis